MEGGAGFRIMVKLRSLKQALKIWNVEVFGHVESKLKAAEAELHSWDLTAEERDLVEDEVRKKIEIRNEVWMLRKRLEWIWLQKSRLSWALKGDKNIRYFHIMASRRQSKNVLDSLKINGTFYEDPAELKQAVAAYFKILFTEVWKTRPRLGGEFRSIDQSQIQSCLVKEFSKAEVWATIKECDVNKAPGPDRFNLTCFQKGWKFMKDDIMKFMQEFHDNGVLGNGINGSFVTLVPKIDSPESITDFRPISLISSVYKVVAKVLANRMKLVLPKIIDRVQISIHMW